MKYELLKAWILETKDDKLVVDKVNYQDSELRLYFVNGMTLRFVRLENEFYPFLQYLRASSKQSSIWQQLEQMLWIKSEIAEMDRILYLHFEYTDIYQQLRRLCLVAECILPQPNLILTKVVDDKLIILDAITKYSLADNPQRQVLPNLPYFPPLTSYKPVQAEVALPLSLRKIDETISFCSTINEYFHKYYTDVLVPRRELQQAKALTQKWQKELGKQEKKLHKQELELLDAEKSEQWHVMAETIKHNLNQIKTGDTELRAINYFDIQLAQINIPLLPDKHPLENMRYYIKKYQKAKKGFEIITANILKTKEEIGVIVQILERIKSGEFVESMLDGKAGSAAFKQKMGRIDKLLRIKIDEDWELLIGRKATENDLITTQIAKAHDWWFHTRIYHGSHVVLRNFHKKEPPAELIEICCSLAAWYSKARFSANVPVDYTQIRFVRKPRKSAPGFVTYTKHNSVFATPKDLRTLKEEQGW